VFLAPGLHFPVMCSCPRVVTILDLAYYEFAEHFTWRFRMRARLLTRLAVGRADHFLAISEATKVDLVRRFRIDPARVTVTHLGCSREFRPRRESQAVRRVREEYKLPDRYILYVGRLQPRKNLVRLIEAFAALRGRRPELPHHLVIAGDQGWLYSSIYQAAKESPARDAIRFLGFVDGDNLPVLMSEADVVALVSLWEGFGLPVIEAMGCGTAVVTSNCSSLPEVAGDAALLVDPYDTEAISGALERVLLDDELRRDLEDRGLGQAARFTWENTARKTMDALVKTASGPGKRD
jgi:glycosyltransferase involved in cell wall biosynthesis